MTKSNKQKLIGPRLKISNPEFRLHSRLRTNSFPWGFKIENEFIRIAGNGLEFLKQQYGVCQDCCLANCRAGVPEPRRKPNAKNMQHILKFVDRNSVLIKFLMIFRDCFMSIASRDY